MRPCLPRPNCRDSASPLDRLQTGSYFTRCTCAEAGIVGRQRVTWGSETLSLRTAARRPPILRGEGYSLILCGVFRAQLRSRPATYSTLTRLTWRGCILLTCNLVNPNRVFLGCFAPTCNFPSTGAIRCHRFVRPQRADPSRQTLNELGCAPCCAMLQ